MLIRKLKALCFVCEELFSRGDEIVQVMNGSSARESVKNRSWKPEKFAHKHCVERPTRKAFYGDGGRWGFDVRRGWAWRRATDDQKARMGELLPQPTAAEKKQAEAVLAVIEGTIKLHPLTTELLRETAGLRIGMYSRANRCSSCGTQIESGEKRGTVDKGDDDDDGERKVKQRDYCKRCLKKFLNLVLKWL